jgi:peptidyl-prolyl cis-trans isomerase A (cyclophilin A)
MKVVASIALFLILSLPAFAQKVKIITTLGSITLQLHPDKAPLTVANFLRYVDEKRYDGGSFYRVVRLDNQSQNPIKIEVIQGGLRQDSAKMLPTIVQETTQKTGLRHVNGTISLARFAPNSGASEFFICINDQPELDYGGKRNPDGQGFAAFGKVVRGMKIVRKIQKGPTNALDKPSNAAANPSQYLKDPVLIVSITRI